MDEATLAALEFDSLKRLLEPFVRSPLGRRALDSLVPSSDPEEIRLRKKRSLEAMHYQEQEGRLGAGDLMDPLPPLERLEAGEVVLEAEAVRRIAAAVTAAGSLKRDIQRVRDRFPALWRMFVPMPDLSAVTRSIQGHISPEGGIESSASRRLGRLRKRIGSLQVRLQKRLEAILSRSEKAGYLQDTYIAVRSGRFVIPVRSEARSAVAGIVHAVSSTKATVFVEPLETMDLNNDLVTERESEAAEVRRILVEWSSLLRGHRRGITAASRIIGEMDLLDAVGTFASRYRCTMAAEAPPEQAGSTDTGVLCFRQARHPVLEDGLRSHRAEPVPLTVTMPGHGGVLVLSGPNAGGKTVALKTIGLLVLMNQAGLPVPAQEAILPFFRRVLADIGDHQSIVENLSTFSARVTRVAEMIRAVEPPALVLLDEVGAGTDPDEAGALAVAIVDRFRRSRAAVVATTHQEALKRYAEAQQGAVNGAMQIDDRSLRPTYQLVAGVTGRSGGIDMAERIGLPADVVRHSRSLLSDDQLETRRYLARLRDAAAVREQELERLRSERRRLQEHLEAQRRALEAEAIALRGRWRAALDEALEKIDQEGEDLVRQIRQRTVALQVRAEARRMSRTLREHLERELSPPEGPPPDESSWTKEKTSLRAGSRVKIATMGTAAETGTIESLDARGRAWVIIRGRRVRVRIEELRLVEPAGSSGGHPAHAASGVAFEGADKRQVPTQVKVIGMTVQEALGILDKFLDDASLAGHAEVRIVHGHGTGRLREAVRKFLRDHPLVESHATATEPEGGDGATVAVLRR